MCLQKSALEDTAITRKFVQSLLLEIPFSVSYENYRQDFAYLEWNISKYLYLHVNIDFQNNQMTYNFQNGTDSETAITKDLNIYKFKSCIEQCLNNLVKPNNSFTYF